MPTEDRRCTAHSKRTGERCKRAAAVGRNVCAIHGGKSLAGVASGTFRHGIYSKYLPRRLRERYKDALSNPDLLRQWSNIALVDSLVVETIKAMDTGESGEVWARLRATWARVELARAERDNDAIAAALVQVADLIEHGSGEHDARLELLALLEQRRKLTESERKLLIEAQQMLSIEQAMALITNVVEIIRQEEKDGATIARIAERLRRLVSLPDGRLVDETD